MFKKLGIILISTFMLFGMTLGSVSAAENVYVQVDGKNVKFPDAQPYVESNRVLIPIRFVSEALGAKVSYKKETTGSRVERVVYVELNGKMIRMPVNSDTVLVGDTIVKLDVPARLQGSRVFVPLRFVSEALGAKVNWNQSKKLVSISTGKEVTEPEPVPDPNNMYSTDFKWDKDSDSYVYNKLAKQLFVNNMKVSNGKLTFTLPEGTKAAYMTDRGAITKLTPGKMYTYSIGKGQGSISFAMIHPDRDRQEGYFVILDSKDDEDLSLLFGDVTNDAIIVVAGNYSGAPLSDVQKLAQQLK
ncbi:copper amine oxidase N-terminal domain-containing protein [Paenibacillus cisolokensis]|uniref:copper amine oxidase N-terminal domain-containing protein n=1 Tax=Paenibacillus cisolokensis TaxID=1658519 RepID=UPI003D265CEB